MSGAEAILLLGVISSIISIVDGATKVYDTATDAQGLPEAFREVSARLPMVQNILNSAKRHIEEGQVDKDSYKGVKPVATACEKKAQKLDEIFHKVIPSDGATDLKRYYKAVRAYGKGNEVERLMQGILEDIQLLSCEQGMKTATKAQQEQLTRAIKEVSAIVPSVPEQEFQEARITASNSGSGTQYIARGEYIAQGEARQYISGGGAMHFDVHYGSSTSRPSNVKVTSQSLPSATPTFFGRKSELKAIEDCLLNNDPGQKSIVLAGIGGLGKTQIALQFWSAHATSYQSRLWIDATSLATVLSSFREVALAVGDNVALGCNDIGSRQPMTAVKSWLALADNTKWLVVIDNVEDLDCDYSLQDIIPKCDHGSILVTTTQSETASVLGALNVEVGTIDNDAGGAILRRRFKRKTCTEEEKRLTDQVIETLHGVPLAIEQAGAYLHFNPSLTTRVLKTFLEKLSSPNISVIDTFSLLKTSLARNNGDSLNILRISAFLAQGEIPFLFLTQPATSGSALSTIDRMRAIYEELQKSPPEALVWLQRITADETTYFMALEILEQFCCIKRRLAPDGSTYLGYSMHNVIRHWSQITLSSEEHAEWTIIAAFQLSQCLQLDAVFAFSHQNFSRHVEHVNRVILDPKYESLVRYPDGPYWWQTFATTCIWARFYQRQRRFDLARRMVEVIILYEKIAYDNKWPSQRESLETLHLQAEIFWEEGDFSNAIQHYKHLLQSCEFHLGHFDNLTTTAFQEMRTVQDRSKRYQRDWQKASCIAELDSPPRRAKEHEKESVSNVSETFGLQHFLTRYSWGAQYTLYDAAHYGFMNDVQLFLDNTTDIDHHDKQRALLAAATNGHEAVVRLLLENGAYVDAKGGDTGLNSLIAAAHNGHEAVVQLLLKGGADIKAKSDLGLTALDEAAQKGHKAIVRLLQENGAEKGAKGRWIDWRQRLKKVI